jgi:hypothetical protein
MINVKWVRICLDWLIWAYLLAYAIVRSFGRAYWNNLWHIYKLFSSYFHKFYRIA